MMNPDNTAPATADSHRTQGWRTFVPTVLAICLAAVHFGFLLVHFEPAISTPDANGYFAQGRLIATEQRTWFATESVLQYVPPHWLQPDSERYFSKYPPGLPVIAAVVFRVFGPEAALLVNPVMASLSLLGLFLICRMWIGDTWGLLAVLLMAVNPAANEQALWAFAHTAVAFFLIWGVYFLARWAPTYSLPCAFGAGVCLGTIPTIRYAEALFGLAFGVFVLLNLRRGGKTWRSLIAATVGAAIPISALCVRNHLAFGAFWKTGYTLTSEHTGFGWGYFVDHAVPYVQQLLSEGSGLMFGLAVVGIAVLCARRDTWKRGVLLVGLIVPTTVLYMSYYWAPDGASMRFLVPTLFVYPIAGVWLLQMLTVKQHRSALAASVVLLLVTIAWGLPTSIQALQRQKHNNASLAHVTRVLTRQVEPGSVLIADRSVQQHLDYVGQWRLADRSVLTRQPGHPIRPPRDSDAPNPRPPRQGNTALDRYASLSERERFDEFSHDIWQWAGDRGKVYWLGDGEQLARLEQQLQSSDVLTTVTTIELPESGATLPDAPGQFRPPRRPGRRPGAGPAARRPGRPRGRRPGGGMPGELSPLQNGEPLLLVEWTREA